MVSLRTASGKPSLAGTAAWLFAELAGFTALLFLTRFVLRGHLIPQMDQECHIGGIAVDVLAHGVRFPLLAYAPNEYDNGSFFSGLLAALSFSLLGRSVLALKLVTHVISAAGAVATLWLLRGCLDELALTRRRVCWTATTVLVIALSWAPSVVTLSSMYAVGNHAEGSAIDTLLLALFVRRWHTRSAGRTAAFWALVGFALYVNKATLLVIPVLAVVEIALSWRMPSRLLAAAAGFALGVLPEVFVVVQRLGMGWTTIEAKAQRGSLVFPQAFVESVFALAEYRIELLAAWILALAGGTLLLLRSFRGVSAAFTLTIVVAVSWMHLLMLAAMAQGGLDPYTIYGYPTLVVLFAVLVARMCAHAATHWGEGSASWVVAATVAITLILYRPDGITWGFAKVEALWRNRAGAACSWRFAEGFEREQQYGLAPPGRTREQHAIERCRSLSEPAQILDCIGGIGRELNWRQKGRVAGEPPTGLSAAERHAYAYQYGTHRRGDTEPCRDFASADLTATCTAAVQLDCLVVGDLYTRLVSGQGIGPPRCTIPAPPMDGYWAEMRTDLLTRTIGSGPNLLRARGEDDLRACALVFDACY